MSICLAGQILERQIRKGRYRRPFRMKLGGVHGKRAKNWDFDFYPERAGYKIE